MQARKTVAGMSPTRINTAFGKALSKLRKEKGYSQEKLGDESDLTRNFISLLERGGRSPTLNSISKIADALGISAESLIKFTFDELRETATPLSKRIDKPKK